MNTGVIGLNVVKFTFNLVFLMVGIKAGEKSISAAKKIFGGLRKKF